MTQAGAAAVGFGRPQGSHLGIVQGDVAALRDAAAQDVALVAEPLDGQAQFESELGEIGAAQVTQLDMLQIVPDAFVGIEFRGVAWELLQLQSGGGPLRQEVFDRLRAVNGRPVPDDEQRARNLAQQMAQELHDCRAAEGALADLQQQPPVHRESADRREMIMGEQGVQDRRLATGRIGPDGPGQGVEGRFIYPHNRPPLALGCA